MKHTKIFAYGICIASLQMPMLSHGQSSDSVATLTPKCATPTNKGDAACWMKVQNHNRCYEWNSQPETNEAFIWLGTCQNNRINGYGTGIWSYDGGKQTVTGLSVDGIAQGQWTLQFEDGEVNIGPYVDGEPHGEWEMRYADGTTETITFINGNPQGSSNKFRVDGKILHYDSSLASNASDQEVNADDAYYFKTILRENPSVKTIYLTSWGGNVESSYEIADLIIDYELNTHVVDICFSACTTVFLGGKKRTMEKASKVGFHRSYWEHENMKSYYESEKENFGWSDVWEFSAWVYDDAQESVYKEFTFLLERNITPLFAIKTLQADSDDGWYPRRKELLDAGFLTK